MRDEKIAYSVTESDNVFIFLNFKKSSGRLFRERITRPAVYARFLCIFSIIGNPEYQMMHIFM